MLAHSLRESTDQRRCHISYMQLIRSLHMYRRHFGSRYTSGRCDFRSTSFFNPTPSNNRIIHYCSLICKPAKTANQRKMQIVQRPHIQVSPVAYTLSTDARCTVVRLQKYHTICPCVLFIAILLESQWVPNA